MIDQDCETGPQSLVSTAGPTLVDDVLKRFSKTFADN